MATYNYGVGLFIDGQYDLAAEQLNKAKAMNDLLAYEVLQKVETELQYSNRMAKRKTTK